MSCGNRNAGSSNAHSQPSAFLLSGTLFVASHKIDIASRGVRIHSTKTPTSAIAPALLQLGYFFCRRRCCSYARVSSGATARIARSSPEI